MKKTLIIASVLGALVSAQAFAKTEGNYIGLDVIRSTSKFDAIKFDNVTYKANDDNVRKYNKVAGGVNYKYAFNFDNLYIAPGIFYDYTDINNKDGNADTYKIDYRYGAKIDLGYDFNDQFAAFIVGGISNNHYNINWKSLSAKNSGNSASGVYGAGIKYAATKDMDLKLGYEFSKVNTKTPDLAEFGAAKVRFDVKTIRLGAAYRF